METTKEYLVQKTNGTMLVTFEPKSDKDEGDIEVVKEQAKEFEKDIKSLKKANKDYGIVDIIELFGPRK